MGEETVTGGCSSDGGAVSWIGIRSAAQITSAPMVTAAMPIHHRPVVLVCRDFFFLSLAKHQFLVHQGGKARARTIHTAMGRPAVVAIISRI